MQVPTGARRIVGLIAALATMAGLWASAPAAPAASVPSAQTGLAQVAGWSAGPAERWTGYQHRHGSRRVREVQRRLARLGFAPGPVDGHFGPRTERATRRFQQHRGLTPDGIVGFRTLTALRAASGSLRAVVDWSAGPVLAGTGFARATGSRRVREVQWYLRALHYAAGPIDGLFGPRTQAAVRRFQTRHGLAADGVVGGRTLMALAIVELRSGAPSLVMPTRTTPTSAPAPPARASAPRSRPLPGPEPVADRQQPVVPVPLVALALAMLGVLAVAVGYGRIRRRIRAVAAERRRHGLEV